MRKTGCTSLYEPVARRNAVWREFSMKKEKKETNTFDLYLPAASIPGAACRTIIKLVSWGWMRGRMLGYLSADGVRRNGK